MLEVTEEAHQDLSTIEAKYLVQVLILALVMMSDLLSTIGMVTIVRVLTMKTGHLSTEEMDPTGKALIMKVHSIEIGLFMMVVVTTERVMMITGEEAEVIISEAEMISG
jgi:hypothetical protein